MRFKYEATNRDGIDESKDLTVYAMERYAYYVCCKCQKVIFCSLQSFKFKLKISIEFSSRRTMEARPDAMSNSVKISIPKNWSVAAAVT